MHLIAGPRGKWLLTTVSTLLTICACYQPARAQAIEGAGATFPAPIYKQWFAGFQQATGISVNYQAIGSGGGYNALKAATVDFAASDAPLSPEEEKALPGPVVHIPTVGGAVALSYNLPGVGEGLRFTAQSIAGIYLGKITHWDDPLIKQVNPNVNLPHLAIQPVHRTDGSGTTYIFTHYLKKADPAWASAVGAGKNVNWPIGLGGKGSDGVTAVVQRTEGGIGYVELTYAIEHKLPFGAVRNRAGNFVSPSTQSTASAISRYVGELRNDIKTPTVDAPGINSYPICSLTYILILKNGGKNVGAVTKLWSWAMQPAPQAQATELNYASLPAALVKINLNTIRSISGAQLK
jgi:phosphate transport system substrate-binding protein